MFVLFCLQDMVLVEFFEMVFFTVFSFEIEYVCDWLCLRSNFKGCIMYVIYCCGLSHHKVLSSNFVLLIVGIVKFHVHCSFGYLAFRKESVRKLSAIVANVMLLRPRFAR